MPRGEEVTSRVEEACQGEEAFATMDGGRRVVGVKRLPSPWMVEGAWWRMGLGRATGILD